MTILIQEKAPGTLIKRLRVDLGVYIVILLIYIANNTIWIPLNRDNMIYDFCITI